MYENENNECWITSLVLFNKKSFSGILWKSWLMQYFCLLSFQDNVYFIQIYDIMGIYVSQFTKVSCFLFIANVSLSKFTLNIVVSNWHHICILKIQRYLNLYTMKFVKHTRISINTKFSRFINNIWWGINLWLFLKPLFLLVIIYFWSWSPAKGPLNKNF